MHSFGVLCFCFFFKFVNVTWYVNNAKDNWSAVRYSVRSLCDSLLHDFIADNKCLPQMDVSSYRKHTQVII